MKHLLDYQNFYLIGIKGVAMTSLAQCLLDAGKTVTGSDVKEDFVTKKHLERLNININLGFNHAIPEKIDCVVYTAAHQGKYNPQVIQAQNKKISTYSHAEALAMLVNQKQGIAVCGVGGKSTVSAMITWILNQQEDISFSVGVGDIIGLNQTGKWTAQSQFFVTEADEYVTDPLALKNGEKITPRFSFLKPYITVCNNLKYDHPDVYQSYAQTQEIFASFFNQIQPNGFLIFNADNQDLLNIAQQQKHKQLLSFGKTNQADFQLISYQAQTGQSVANFKFKNQVYSIKLKIPGQFNILNGLAAIAACYAAGQKIDTAINNLANFASTIRRFEFIGEKQNVKYYDDYAHHPSEVKATIQALNEWYPSERKIIAFQSHTFSRTKKLFNDFVHAFSDCQELIMLDIFPSARESVDPSISSDLLCQEIHNQYPHIKINNLHTHENMAQYLRSNLQKGDVCITIGAGDINKVHQLIKQ